MKRLVYWTSIEGSGDTAVVDDLGIEDCMKIQEPLRRLAAYEKTSMAPEEVAELNDFTRTQAGKLLYKLNKLQGQVVLCRDCEYLACEKTTGVYWCRLSSGLDVMDLRPEDGCSRGKRKEVTEDEERKA
jgi:hypothetical protein